MTAIDIFIGVAIGFPVGFIIGLVCTNVIARIRYSRRMRRGLYVKPR